MRSGEATRAWRVGRRGLAIAVVGAAVIIGQAGTSYSAKAPTSGGCGENSFLGGGLTPPPGSTIDVAAGGTATVSAVYHDESAISNSGGFAPTYALTNAAGGTVASGTPSESPTSPPPGTKDKFNTRLSAALPSGLPSGTYTMTIKAWDSDQNKPGGDCGVASWSFQVHGSPPPNPPSPPGPGASVLPEVIVRSIPAAPVVATPSFTG